MNEVYNITAETGDEYRLQFTTDRSGLISDDLLDELAESGMEVIEVGLGRIRGNGVTGHKTLSLIEACIADVLERHPYAVMSFFCDFISMLPVNSKGMAVQEYRSRLFSAMFRRYVAQQNPNDYCDKEVKIEGEAEDYFLHAIYRKQHAKYAEMIADGHKRDFGKPE